MSQHPAFSWMPVTSTTQYEFQLATAPTFGSATIFTDSPSSAATVVPATTKLEQGKQYFWRIRALQPVQGDWSAAGNFMVAAPAPTSAPITITSVPAPVITIPPAAPVPTITLRPSVPLLSSPANGSIVSNQHPAFSWTPVASTTTYEFHLSTSPTFATTVYVSTPAVAGTVLPGTITLEQGKQYFWRVRALQPVQGDWSAVANFVVVAAATNVPPVTITSVPAPTISSPVNGATVTNTNPAFSWTPVTGTTQYEFQLSTSPAFVTTVFTAAPTSAGLVTPAAITLQTGTQYFWRVRTSQPVESNWSSVANFFVTGS